MARATDVHDLATQLHGVTVGLLRRARVDDMASGMSATRLSVLSVLVYGTARTVTDLAEAEQVAVPTMTRLLQGMEEAGHIRRRRDPQDRRVLKVSVTPGGRRALEQARRARVRRLSAVLEQVRSEDLAVVERAVEVLRGALGR